MNKRIREIAEQAGVLADYETTNEKDNLSPLDRFFE